MTIHKKKIISYNGNKLLKPIGTPIEFTQHQLGEWIRCSNDPVYFIRKYVNVLHVDKGIVPFELYNFQEKIIQTYHLNRKVICLVGRQSGKTITTAAFFLWVILFQSDKGVAIMANKASVAREILSRIKFAYEYLPTWIQQGVKEWNKGSIELENNSFVIAAATSPNAIRGYSVSYLYIDETAFIPKGVADEFFTSVFPTISSGKETKIFLSSTPKGLNHFHKFWNEANSGENGFVPVSAVWSDVPDRDDVWLQDQRKTLGELKFRQEVMCEFLGSSKTLIDGKFLGTLTFSTGIHSESNFTIFEMPIEKHSYVCTVDTSRGQYLDYSALVMIDVTAMPYKVVATFKDNTTSAQEYPHLIYKACTLFNDAYALIEVNDIGGAVADDLYRDYEYEHLYFTHKNEINEGFGYPGIRTTKKVKAIGCSVLKDLIEQEQLILTDYRIIEELTVYEKKGASYAAADESINDDLTSCLFLFGWLTKQTLFKELTSTNVRAILAKRMNEYIDANVLPFGARSDGFEDEDDNSWLKVDDTEPHKSNDPLYNWIMS